MTHLMLCIEKTLYDDILLLLNTYRVFLIQRWDTTDKYSIGKKWTEFGGD
jgi:hypothetical protein